MAANTLKTIYLSAHAAAVKFDSMDGLTYEDMEKFVGAEFELTGLLDADRLAFATVFDETIKRLRELAERPTPAMLLLIYGDAEKRRERSHVKLDYRHTRRINP